ncbi:hypothetical protein [Hydrogenophaga defluvii]|uniref:Uncharacterized protein n=1 Tax=Hydrogenophaga defluvii TaxID=249410 RepID=A0ABW2SHA8_9BURK
MKKLKLSLAALIAALVCVFGSTAYAQSQAENEKRMKKVCAFPRDKVCAWASRLAKESQSSPTLLRAPNGMLVLPAREFGPALIFPIEVKWTHAEFDWLIRQGKTPGVVLETMKKELRAKALEGCRQWPADQGPALFLRGDGVIVFEYVSLDDIVIDSFAIKRCDKDAIVDVPFERGSEIILQDRKLMVEKWDSSQRTYLLAGGSSKCDLSESGTPLSPWGNRRKYEEVASVNPVERWHVITALFEDGTTETLFHFRDLAGCKRFIARMDGVTPVPNRLAQR